MKMPMENEYECSDIKELYGEDFYTWRDEVDQYRFYGYTIYETAKHFNIAPRVVEQFDELELRSR